MRLFRKPWRAPCSLTTSVLYIHKRTIRLHRTLLVLNGTCIIFFPSIHGNKWHHLWLSLSFHCMITVHGKWHLDIRRQQRTATRKNRTFKANQKPHEGQEGPWTLSQYCYMFILKSGHRATALPQCSVLPGKSRDVVSTCTRTLTLSGLSGWC